VETAAHRGSSRGRRKEGDDRWVPLVSGCRRRWATQDAAGPEAELGYGLSGRRRTGSRRRATTSRLAIAGCVGEAGPRRADVSGRGKGVGGAAADFEGFGLKQNRPEQGRK
jgi:hypothetical protein